jgi:predicted CoA-binding protein
MDDRSVESGLSRGDGAVKIADAAAEFLSLDRIAVTGVSSHPEGHGSNTVYARLRERGYTVFAVNPNAESAEGDPTYPDLASIPGGVQAVVIATAADRAPATMREIVDLGITYAWMHRSFGAGSVSDEATRIGREAGVMVIDGGCPLMFGRASDGGHRMMCRMMKLTGKVPRTV